MVKASNGSWPSCPGCGGRARYAPTHVVKVRAPRHWRTRKDPFEGVWADVLAWLQAEPDATGKSLMERLQLEHPDRFSEGSVANHAAPAERVARHHGQRAGLRRDCCSINSTQRAVGNGPGGNGYPVLKFR